MNPRLFEDIVYQLRLVEKLLEKETNPFKRCRYLGIEEALLYILEREYNL